MEQDTIEILRQQYFEAIVKLQDKQDIIGAMPKPEYESFFPIIYGLVDLIEKSIVELKVELNSINTNEPEMKEYFQEEIEIMKYKKEICMSLLKQGKETLATEHQAQQIQEKNLIFATTEVGNIYIERDLKDLPEEYYDSVGESLQKLVEGFTEENAQKGRGLQNNGKLAGLHEVKPFKVRIFYRNLSPDTVFILLVRMKKSNNNQLDRDEAIIRKKQTQKEYDQLKEEIKIPERKEELIRQSKEVKERIFGYIKKYRRG